MATGRKKAIDFVAVQLAAEEAMCKAITNAVDLCAQYEIIGDMSDEERIEDEADLR